MGREAFDASTRQTLEARYPGITFDWRKIAETPFPPPDAEYWRERRRAEKAAKQARRAVRDEEPAPDDEASDDESARDDEAPADEVVLPEEGEAEEGEEEEGRRTTDEEAGEVEAGGDDSGESVAASERREVSSVEPRPTTEVDVAAPDEVDPGLASPETARDLTSKPPVETEMPESAGAPRDGRRRSRRRRRGRRGRSGSGQPPEGSGPGA